ncbi:hypothetical protein L7F22_042848 [Adiantum nelumboides]|nr:hypothetical protein [Adiantum nelumboides]
MALAQSTPATPSQKAIAQIQDLLEQDDQDASLSSFGDLIAFRSKASEFAAILKEDSPALNWSWNSPVDNKRQTLQQAELQDHMSILTSLTKCLPEVPRNRVLLLNSLKSSQSINCMPSKVLDVGLFRYLQSRPSTLIKGEKDEDSDVEKNVIESSKHDEAQKAGSVLKPRKDLRIGKPRLHKYTDMSSNKRSYYDECAGVKIGKAGFPMHIDLNDMLLQCAYAVGLNDTTAAKAVACKVKQQTSPYGSAAERLAHYFVKALYARFAGTGWSLYTGHLSQPRPSPTQILESTMKYISSCPFTKASHLFANETVLGVAKRASTLHIIEHQMTGLQYPSLFKQLAALPGGPPKVKLVGLVVPHYSMLPAQTEVLYSSLEEIGRRLAKCAALFKVPFHFTAWVGTRGMWRLQDFVSSKRPPEEVFVFISTSFLRFVMDDILDPRPVRLKSFKMLCDVRPDVFIQGVVSGAYSTPFYSTRFKEALFHFACVFDVLETFIERNNSDRVVFESEVLGKAILNVVACEGLLVSGRVEKYKQWQAALEEAGMQQLSLNANTVHQVEGLLKSWHKDYIVTEDRQYLLLGWKGRILYALATWKSSESP